MRNGILNTKDTKSTKFKILDIQNLRLLRALVVNKKFHNFSESRG